MPDLNQLLNEMPIPDVGEAMLYIWEPNWIINHAWGHMALEFNRGGSLFLSPNSPLGYTLQRLADETVVGLSSPFIVTNGYIITPNAVFYVDKASQVITAAEQLTYYKPNTVELLSKLKFRAGITRVEHHILNKKYIEIIKAAVDYKGYVLLMANSPVGRQLQNLVQESGLASPLNETVIFTPDAVYYVNSSDEKISEANQVASLNEARHLIDNLVITIPSEGIIARPITEQAHAKNLLQYAPYPTCANSPVSYVSFWPNTKKTDRCPVRPHWYDKGTDLVVQNDKKPFLFLLKSLNLNLMHERIEELKSNPNLRYKFVVEGQDSINNHYNCVSMVLNLFRIAGVEEITGKSVFLEISKFWESPRDWLIDFTSDGKKRLILILSYLIIIIGAVSPFILLFSCAKIKHDKHSGFGLLCYFTLFDLFALMLLVLLLIFSAFLCARPLDVLIPTILFFLIAILMFPMYIVSLLIIIIIAVFCCVSRELITGYQYIINASVSIRNILALSPDSTTIQELLETLREHGILVDKRDDELISISSTDNQSHTMNPGVTDLETGIGTQNENTNEITTSRISSSSYGRLHPKPREERIATGNTRNWCLIL